MEKLIHNGYKYINIEENITKMCKKYMEEPLNFNEDNF